MFELVSVLEHINRSGGAHNVVSFPPHGQSDSNGAEIPLRADQLIVTALLKEGSG